MSIDRQARRAPAVVERPPPELLRSERQYVAQPRASAAAPLDFAAAMRRVEAEVYDAA